MTFKVQYMNKGFHWVNMMSGLGCEQSAIRWAENRAKQISEKIRVICNRGSVVYMCN